MKKFAFLALLAIWLAIPAAAAQNVPCGTGQTPIATGVTALTFTDSTVVDGNTYYYTATGTDADGNVSGCSNIASGVVPATGTHTVTLNWKASTGGVAPYSYSIFRTSPPTPPTGLAVQVN